MVAFTAYAGIQASRPSDLRSPKPVRDTTFDSLSDTQTTTFT